MTVVVAAGAQSLASWSVLFATPVAGTLARSGAGAVLTPFTGWTTSVALVATVLSWTVSVRDDARWWRPSATGTWLLAGWTAAAWLDGAHSTRALLDGLPSQTWFAWPGDGTPLHHGDPGGPTTWSLDLLSATGPVVVAVALWVGPLLLRDLEAQRRTGRPPAAGWVTSWEPGVGAGAPGDEAALGRSGVVAAQAPEATSLSSSPRAVLAREVHRATHVAAAVAVLLCAGVVLLQVAGGIFSVSSPLGEAGWDVLLDPGFLAVVGALAAAWLLGAPLTLTSGASPAWRGAVVTLLLAVVATALLVRLDPDLLILVSGACGVLVATTRTIVSGSLVRLLVGGDLGSSTLDGDEDQEHQDPQDHDAVQTAEQDVGGSAGRSRVTVETGAPSVAATPHAAPTTKPPSESVAL